MLWIGRLALALINSSLVYGPAIGRDGVPTQFRSSLIGRSSVPGYYTDCNRYHQHGWGFW